MARASVREMPKNAASAANASGAKKAPYAAEVPCSSTAARRETGQWELAVQARSPSSFNAGGSWQPPGIVQRICREARKTRSGASCREVITAIAIVVVGIASRSTVTAATDISVVSAMKLAIASIVGWSNMSVCGNSVSKRSASAFVSSVAAIESSPTDMSGASVATLVPRISESVLEMVSTTAVVLWALALCGRCIKYLGSCAVSNLGSKTSSASS
mmetsp:Transcript_11835/g.32734  ORF Transcript_11835/g.32734 Transcript_11835/m.32734 type:complete len:217 (-) Transcript_11835:1627-2277(-)